MGLIKNPNQAAQMIAELLNGLGALGYEFSMERGEVILHRWRHDGPRGVPRLHTVARVIEGTQEVPDGWHVAAPERHTEDATAKAMKSVHACGEKES